MCLVRLLGRVYKPATGETGEVLVDGVDAAQLDGGLVVVLPDLFQAVSVVVATARVLAGYGGRTPTYEIPMVAVLLFGVRSARIVVGE